MIVTEDSEEMVMIAEQEANQPTFDTPVKSYRIMEGMGVTFHCKMAGTPLPKVQPTNQPLIATLYQNFLCHTDLCLPGVNVS